LLDRSQIFTRRAGGTLKIMKVVLPLAATMILGGFFGRGFIRSWCLGCLAILIWYERLRKLDPSFAFPPIRSRLEIAHSQPLLVRQERFHFLENHEPVRLI